MQETKLTQTPETNNNRRNTYIKYNKCDKHKHKQHMLAKQANKQ